MVYAATAFVVLQAGDLILPRLAVPDWAMSLIVVLVLLGFRERGGDAGAMAQSLGVADILQRPKVFNVALVTT